MSTSKFDAARAHGVYAYTVFAQSTQRACLRCTAEAHLGVGI